MYWSQSNCICDQRRVLTTPWSFCIENCSERHLIKHPWTFDNILLLISLHFTLQQTICWCGFSNCIGGYAAPPAKHQMQFDCRGLCRQRMPTATGSHTRNLTLTFLYINVIIVVGIGSISRIVLFLWSFWHQAVGDMSSSLLVSTTMNVRKFWLMLNSSDLEWARMNGADLKSDPLNGQWWRL